MPNKISIFLPNLRGGGAERVFVDLANAFASRGYDVEFVLMAAQGELVNELSGNVSIHNLEVARIRTSLFPLISYLKSRKPDIFFGVMWPLTIIGLLAYFLSGMRKHGCRMVLSDHTILSLTPENQSPLRKIILRKSIRFFYPLADIRLTVSNGSANDIQNLSGLGAKLTVDVIYNPISLKEIEVNEDYYEKEFRYRIISVGSFKAVKDHHSLINAFAQIKDKIDAELVILGEGALRSELEQLIEDLDIGSYVKLPGFKLDLSRWYRSSDLFVLSSKHEGFGNVIVEALQYGVPVVSTDCPSGPKEILGHNVYGRLVPVGDISALGEAMLESLHQQHDTGSLKSRAADFTIDSIADQYIDLIFSN